MVWLRFQNEPILSGPWPFKAIQRRWRNFFLLIPFYPSTAPPLFLIGLTELPMLMSDDMMNNSNKWLRQLKKILPASEVILDPKRMADYSGDKWFAVHQPDVVVLPRN